MRAILLTMSIGYLAGHGVEEVEFRIEETTIRKIHLAMSEGTLTSRHLVELYLHRIRSYDQSGPKINSVILVNPNALARADELDQQFTHSGLTGALHGIPVLLKDNIETSDMPTTGGSLSLAGFQPDEDAHLTQELRSAGAIILAKVNLTEFAASGITRSSLGGQTLNPYDLTRTPGGSSGGTGAAVAANFAVVGIGTDTVNSIRSPSSANSLVGIRPTKGLVSRSGIIPYSMTQDTAGPIGRTVNDAYTVLSIIAGYDEKDSSTASSIGNQQPVSPTFKADSLKGARLGILRSFFGNNIKHKEVNLVTQEALKAMQLAGASLIEISVPIDADQLISEVSVSGYEFDEYLSKYLQSSGIATASLQAVLNSGKYEPVLKQLYESALKKSVNDDEYKKRLTKRRALRKQIMKIIAEHQLDALVYPLQKRLVVPIGEDQVDRNGVLSAVTGFPAITVPAGFSKPTATAPIGVPIGIEFFGKPFSESQLIDLAYSFEQLTNHRKPPKSTPPLY